MKEEIKPVVAIKYAKDIDVPIIMADKNNIGDADKLHGNEESHNIIDLIGFNNTKKLFSEDTLDILNKMFAFILEN